MRLRVAVLMSPVLLCSYLTAAPGDGLMAEEDKARQTEIAEVTKLRTQALKLRTGLRKYKEAAELMDTVLPRSRELGHAHGARRQKSVISGQ